MRYPGNIVVLKARAELADGGRIGPDESMKKATDRNEVELDDSYRWHPVEENRSPLNMYPGNERSSSSADSQAATDCVTVTAVFGTGMCKNHTTGACRGTRAH